MNHCLKKIAWNLVLIETSNWVKLYVNHYSVSIVQYYYLVYNQVPMYFEMLYTILSTLQYRE